MDGTRFDDVTRLIGAGVSRRKVVKSIAAGLLGLGGIRAASKVAGAQDSSGACGQVNDPCGGLNSPCCGPLVCLGDEPVCTDPTVCQPSIGGVCNDTLGPTCCGGRPCTGSGGSYGVCLGCIAEGNVCDGQSDGCCPGLACTSGVCSKSCIGEGEPCSAWSPGCCGGMTCDFAQGLSGTCVVVAPTCRGVGETCGVIGDIYGRECCGGLVCNGEGRCEEGQVECMADADCAPCHGCSAGTCVWMCDETCSACDDGAGEHGQCIFDCRAQTGPSCCGPEDTCNQETGLCEFVVPPDCVTDTDCATGEICTDGVCTTATCSGDGDCASGTCCCQNGSCSESCCEETDPTDNGGGDPTDNGGGDPTDNGGGDPTDNGGGDPTDNGGGTPTDNGGGDPVDNSGGEPVDNSGGEPVDNSGGEPVQQGETSGVRSLPKTGSGRGAEHGSGLLGAGIAAAALAYVTGKRVRSSDHTS